MRSFLFDNAIWNIQYKRNLNLFRRVIYHINILGRNILTIIISFRVNSLAAPNNKFFFPFGFLFFLFSSTNVLWCLVVVVSVYSKKKETKKMERKHLKTICFISDVLDDGFFFSCNTWWAQVKETEIWS